MPTWLNVAEKPSVAKQINAVLANGRSETVRTLSKYNPVFKFQYRGTTMLVTSVAGHLMEEDFVGAAKNWNSFPMRELFHAPISKSVKASLLDVKKNIESLMRQADTLVLWLDCDREGENIGFEVVRVAAGVKQNFTVKRAHFSALTQRDIQFAIHHLREPDRRLSEAVEARQEMDLRIGAAFTRFQTLRMRDSVPGISGVISFGPCQFPALGFVLRREWERQGFKPEDFFNLRLYHDNSVFQSTRGSVYDQLGATLIYEDMLKLAASPSPLPSVDEEGGMKREEVQPFEAVVIGVRQRQNNRRPPFPLSTVTLQKLAATHLRISSEQCMKLAESLYQEGFLSYPRTETDHFSFTRDELLDFARVQKDHPVVGEFAAKMVDNPSTRFRMPLHGGNDDKAHPPIHPTKLFSGPPDDPKTRLYTLVAQQFLACLSPDAVEAQTTVSIVYGGESFTTSGFTVVEQGWSEVFPYAQRRSSTIPNYVVHQTFSPSSVRLEKSVTAPPPRLTETALISQMDENGIGTDATIAQHIKTLLDRNYVQRVGQSMEPTPLGMALGAAYEVLGLSSLLQPQLRAQMEAAMGEIAAGKASKSDVVKAAIVFYSEVFERLSAKSTEFLRLVRHFFQGGAPTRMVENRGEDSSFPNPSVYLEDVSVLNRSLGPCGMCGRSMDLVGVSGDASSRRFLQCSHCREQYRLPGSKFVNITSLVSSDHESAFQCPVCHYPVLQIENKGRQTKYTLCPYCFSHPPSFPSSGAQSNGGMNGLSDIETLSDFRCLQCLHSTCPLAKGKEQIGIAKCIACGAHDLRLRSNSLGYYLSCSGYPSCTLRIRLPRATLIEAAPPDRCSHCSAVMLLFDFRGGLPLPGCEVVEKICVQCDIRLKEYLEVIQPREGASGSLTEPASGSSGYKLPAIQSISGSGTNNTGNAEGVKCACGILAKQLMSKKESSFGKAFRTCANRKCNFFEWCQ